jgi:hypothetical protein
MTGCENPRLAELLRRILHRTIIRADRDEPRMPIIGRTSLYSECPSEGKRDITMRFGTGECSAAKGVKQL